MVNNRAVRVADVVVHGVVADDGEQNFEGRKSHSFGPLTTAEWNVMFYKHLDHHLTQFGV